MNLLLGKNGQLGKALLARFLTADNFVALDRTQLDLADLKKIKKTLEEIKPRIIINAAAYTAVDKAELESEEAFRVNHHAVTLIADYAKKNNALFIHYSTDYVFDGKNKAAYHEQDNTAPLNNYGLSKQAGERAILDSGCLAVIFRTSWVFSAHGNNFIKTILTLAQKKENLTIVYDQYGSPTSVEFIAHVTLLALSAYKKNQLIPGLYHLSSSGVTNWHTLACYSIKRAMACAIKFLVDPLLVQPILSENYPQIAARPKNSVLNTHKLALNFNLTIPHWAEYVDRMIHQLIEARFFI